MSGKIFDFFLIHFPTFVCRKNRINATNVAKLSTEVQLSTLIHEFTPDTNPSFVNSAGKDFIRKVCVLKWIL